MQQGDRTKCQQLHLPAVVARGRAAGLRANTVGRKPLVSEEPELLYLVV